jgi:two-component system, NtrC family, sensor kinase
MVSRLRGNNKWSHHCDMSTEEHVILVIDDGPSNIKVLVETLKAKGFATAIARNGETGLQRAEICGDA